MPRILIADDSEANRHSMAKILSSAGYEVFTAQNGDEALHQFKRHKPDILITDLNMPVMDGVELAREIRSLKKYSHVPIVFVSAAYREMTSKVKAMDIGSNDFLTHPVDSEELLFKIKAMLRSKYLYDELLKSREVLRKNEIKYHTMFESATDAIYLIDAETHRIIDCNSKASEMTGYPVKELLTMSIEDLSPVEEQDVVSRIFQKILKEGALSGISGTSQVCKDGVTVPVEFNATTIKMGKTVYCLSIFRDITERVNVENALKKSEDKYRSLFRHMSLGCALHKIVLDQYNRPVDYVFIEVNDAFEKLTGLKRADVIGKKVTEVIPGIRESKFDWIGEYGKVAMGGETLQSEQYSEALKRWYSISAYRPMQEYFTVLFEDITKYKQAEERLLSAEEKWEKTFDTIPDLIAIMDNEHRVVNANSALLRKLGTTKEKLIGSFCYEVIHGTSGPPSFCPHSSALMSGKENIREVYEENLKGYYIVSASPIFDSQHNPIGVVEVARDITDRKKLEEQLQEAAIKDELTGLFNRRGFKTFAHQQLTLANRKKLMMSLVYLDIDDMKTINDEFGHPEGDRALTDTAHVMRSTFRRSDIMARIGGDEFAVLLVDHSHAEMKNIVIDNIRKHLMKVNNTPGRSYELSLSIGVASYDPAMPCSIDELMSGADASMYEHKKQRHGKGIMRPRIKEFIEKRASPRYKTGHDYWAVLDGFERSRMVDISFSGIRVHSSHFLNIDSIHALRIVSPGHKDIECSATVVRSLSCNPPGDASAEAVDRFETAFKFGEIPGRGRQSLDALISSLSN